MSNNLPNSERQMPRSRALRARGLSEEFGCYSITKCVEGRLKVLHQPCCAAEILSTIDFARHQDWMRVLAF
jgi:hypothetical protein